MQFPDSLYLCIDTQYAHKIFLPFPAFKKHDDDNLGFYEDKKKRFQILLKILFSYNLYYICSIALNFERYDCEKYGIRYIYINKIMVHSMHFLYHDIFYSYFINDI